MGQAELLRMILEALAKNAAENSKKAQAAKEAAIQAALAAHDHEVVIRGFLEGFAAAFGMMAVVALVKLAMRGSKIT